LFAENLPRILDKHSLKINGLKDATRILYRKGKQHT